MMEEDLTLRVVNDTENRQSLLYGIGDQQLEVTVSKLLGRYKVDVEISKPKFAFRERSAGKWRLLAVIRNSPVDMDSLVTLRCPSSRPAISRHLYIFEEKVFGGAVPKNYFPAVEKGVQECCTKGPLAGYPVVGIKQRSSMAPTIRLTPPRWHSRWLQPWPSRRALWMPTRFS